MHRHTLACIHHTQTSDGTQRNTNTMHYPDICQHDVTHCPPTRPSTNLPCTHTSASTTQHTARLPTRPPPGACLFNARHLHACPTTHVPACPHASTCTHAHTGLANNIVMACIVMAYTDLDNNLLCRNKSLSECILTDLALLRGHEHLNNPNSMHRAYTMQMSLGDQKNLFDIISLSAHRHSK